MSDFFFAHCILARYTVVVRGNHSSVVGSYYGHRWDLPILVLVVYVDACHQPEDFGKHVGVHFVYFAHCSLAV